MAFLDTILLVDDDDTTNFLHTRLLNRLSVAEKIEVATNGDEALQYLLNHCQKTGCGENAARCPNLVLLDIKMPVMDGFEFLEQYNRIREKLSPDIRILILSSSMNPVDTERLKNFPVVQDHLIKPLSETMIQQMLNQYFPAAG